MNTDFCHTSNENSRSSFIIDQIPGFGIIGDIAVGIAIVDPRGRIVTANRALQSMLGYNAEELCDSEFNRLVDSEDLLVDAVIFKKDSMLGEGERYQAEKRFIRKDGRILWTRLTISVLSNTLALTDLFIATIEDISKCKQAEEALIAEKKRLAITLGSIGDGVITTDTDAKIVLMNKAAEDLTGWSQNEAAGMPFSKVFQIIDQKTGVHSLNSVGTVLDTGKGMAVEDVVLVARQGVERYISFSVAPIRNTPGDYLGTVLVFRDTTEKRKMEDELLKSQKLESIGILAGGIAHDFNNILAGILANVQLAKLSYQKGRDITKNLAGTEEAVKRAADLTKQLLSFSKGGSPIKKVTSVAELIRDTVDFTLHGSKVKCEYSLPQTLWHIEADPGQISQMINNLIINADQAMPEGGIIQVSAENIQVNVNEVPSLKPGAYVKIVIKDNGVGIPDVHLGKIFDPYFTTKEKGSGLGLSTSYSIIKRHEGYINVMSKVGEGATFGIYLPATLSDSVPADQETYTAVNGKGKLLLMDDEETIRNVVGQILRHLGYIIDLAKDGSEVIHMYQRAKDNQEPYDLIIMDLTIPGGIGGKETLRKLKEIDPDVKAIVSSGYSADPVLADYKKNGFSGVVTKPYKIEELSTTLHRILSA